MEERRRQISSLLAQSYNQTEISIKLNVNQSTISRDIKVLKKMSERFIFDLAKSDLAFCYYQCIKGIDEVKRKCWRILEYDTNKELSKRDELYTLKLIKECDESKFTLLEKGPSIMALKSLQDRVDKITVEQQDI